jgi:hypothetical protein
MNCIALQYNIGLKDQPVRVNVAFPDRSTALCSSVSVQPPMPPGFRGTWADLNRLNDATSDPSALVHSHHTGIPALEWIT